MSSTVFNFNWECTLINQECTLINQECTLVNLHISYF